MTIRLYSFARFVIFCSVFIVALAASADIVYENGPINGQVNSWMINFNSSIGDSFAVSGGPTTIAGMAFGAWLVPGDTFNSVEVTISSEPFGGQIFFDQQVPLTTSDCSANRKGFLVCTETALFQGPGLGLNNGTYYLELGNAMNGDPNDPVGWDENSGVGCSSQGCPSQGYDNGPGTIPSESFTVLSGVAGTTPEPSSLVLFVTGFAGLVAAMRRRLG